MESGNKSALSLEDQTLATRSYGKTIDLGEAKVGSEIDNRYDYLMDLMQKNITRGMKRRVTPKNEKWSSVISKHIFKHG